MSQERNKRCSAVALERQRVEGLVIRVVSIGLIVYCICGLVAFCQIVICGNEGPDPLHGSEFLHSKSPAAASLLQCSTDQLPRSQLKREEQFSLLTCKEQIPYLPPCSACLRQLLMPLICYDGSYKVLAAEGYHRHSAVCLLTSLPVQRWPALG